MDYLIHGGRILEDYISHDGHKLTLQKNIICNLVFYLRKHNCTPIVVNSIEKKSKLPFYLSQRYVSLGLFVLSFLLYANTLGHDFTQDDAIVITDNIYTKKGISGVGDIWSHDTFHGFFQDDAKTKLVSGGRYRPLSLTVFCAIWSVAGDQAWLYHMISVLLFSLTVIMLFHGVRLVVSRYFTHSQSVVFALIAGVIFAVHPIHTEVVANIKGLDETLSLLFVLISFLLSIRYVEARSIAHLFALSISFLLALFAKESALPFIVLIPLTLYFFVTDWKLKVPVRVFTGLLFVFVVYMLIRISVIGLSFGSPPIEMLNNPFIKYSDGQYLAFSATEKFATILWSFGKYIQLLFFPYPLTHDYYPRHVGVMSFSDLSVLMSILMNVLLVVIAITGWRRKSFISYLILFFYATIFLVSNIIFPIGTHLSERFLFVPSVAFCLLLSYCYLNWRTKVVGSHLPTVALILVLITWGSMTIQRNQVWKDNYTLFTTDVLTSTNSAKVRNAAAGSMVDRAATWPESTQKTELLQEALVHIDKALAIHPNYDNAYLIKGNALVYLRQYDQAITAYRRVLQLKPNSKDVINNLPIALGQAARTAGESGNITLAKQYLTEGLQYKPEDYELNSLMGIAHGNEGNHLSAYKYFLKASQIDPNNARAHVNLGSALDQLGRTEEARKAFDRANQLDPNSLNQ